MSLLMAGGLEPMIFKVPSNPYHSMILWFYVNNLFSAQMIISYFFPLGGYLQIGKTDIFILCQGTVSKQIHNQLAQSNLLLQLTYGK